MFLAWLSFFPLLYGCGSTEMYAGRQALIANKPDVAVAHFQSAAERDPNAVLYLGAFHQSVWTYLGRAQYLTGNFSEARQSLAKALAQHPDDPIARMYLGLTLARDNDRPRAVPEIASGMKGIHDRIDYIVVNRIGLGEFWDPNMEMRSEIEHNLAMIDSNTIDWPRLISSGERLGVEMEEEVERVRNDWEADFGSGGSAGQ
jgi:tetratricopeptide (TPR) repeat protein